MTELNLVGGAEIGFAHGTWPFARLEVSGSGLQLKLLFTVYDFRSNEVVSLDRVGFLRKGIRIVHSRQDYPSRMIFWHSGDLDELLERIRQAGFEPTAPSESRVSWQGMPLRWSAMAILFCFWNALFFLGDLFPKAIQNVPTAFALAPLLAAFLFCWIANASPLVQKAILQPGVSVNRIKPYLSLIQCVTGPLFIVFAAAALFQLLR